MEETGNLRRLRLDFVWETVSFDQNTGEGFATLIPDPRRYEWKEKDGKQWLVDRFDNTWIAKEAFIQCVQNLKGMPIYSTPQTLGNAQDYATSRLPHIRAALQGEVSIETFEDKSDEFLRRRETDELEFVIASVDLVGSTRMVKELPPEVYNRIISTLSFELSHLIPDFHGFVLKFTGDGLIAYFTAPRVMIKHDHAIDCALAMRRIVYEGINPVLTELGFPTIDIRIGLDSGQASVLMLGSGRAKRHLDVIGAVVNVATKVQGLARPGECLIGHTCVESLHTNWREVLEPIELPEDWPHKERDGGVYRVYRCRL